MRALLPQLLRRDRQSDRVVPRSGHTAWLTSFTAGAMTFLAVFALALSMAAGRMADRWSDALARTATVRISAPADQIEMQTRAVLDVLATTPGVESARALSDEEQRKLLEPWFGPDLPVDSLPLPRLVELTEDSTGYDADGLRQRLLAEAPGAVLDDHTRWRRPLAVAAGRLRLLGLVSILLIGGTMAGMITLAAHAALAANAQVIRVLRLVGARDSYIARAFVRRFTLRALAGSAVGALLGMIGVAILPSADTAGGFLTGLGFTGWGWLLPAVLPLLAAAVAFAATRFAAFSRLKELT
ncbi:cell division transport system permease protein [Gemmobacter caeni]|jgi:cell division transport system permease protein|uniref:Cell division transport system permease protein n=2 Tax=Gemmobacter TaxID=204456 RepID=A0A2T6B694_9RHOB|nr:MULTISPECIES: cell division protein FtsX [Gemmobacter]PTX51578.1 cell division transport system permease protein [Gemmobacter caeni]TWJ03706.1 cell division transport system permease protein [Gemmobacter caeni]GHC13043.1 cell division protein FtsX [Gemmobacter nanjingensis]